MEGNYIDFATITIYLFWAFFAGLLIYLRREDKREGYPLESDRRGVVVQGYPAMPEPRAPRAPHPALARTSEPAVSGSAPPAPNPAPAGGAAPDPKAEEDR
jgi:photosynthetic reaction center H subunit